MNRSPIPRLIAVFTVLAVSMSFTAAIEINDSEALRYSSGSDMDFRVDTNGKLHVYNDVTVEPSSIGLTGGNVGIGTTSPAQQLDVAGSAVLGNGTAVNEFSTDDTLSDNSDDAVPTEQAIKAYVDSSASNASNSSTQTLAEVLSEGDTANDGQQINIDKVRARDGDGLELFDDGDNGVFVDDGGNVGIETTSPAQQLDVAGSAVLGNGTAVNEFSTDDTLSDNSDDAVPTEQAVKQYVTSNDGTGMTSWIIQGDSGSTTVNDGDTVAVAGGSGLTSSESNRNVSIGVNTGVGIETNSDDVRIASGAAGSGLAGGSGSALSVNTGNGLTVNSDDVEVATDGIGNSEIDNSVNVDLGTLDVSGGAAGDGSDSGLTVDSSGNVYLSGSLNFPGDVNIVDQQTLNGSFLPSQDASFDLGSSSQTWRDLELSRDFVFDGTTFTESNLDALSDGTIQDSEVENDLTIGTSGSVQAEAIDQEGATSGDVLKWDGSNWQPGSTSSGTDDQNLQATSRSGSTVTIPIENGSSTSFTDEQGMTSWVVAGDTGSTTVTNGSTVTVSGGTQITTSQSSGTVTINNGFGSSIGTGEASFTDQGVSTSDSVTFNDVTLNSGTNVNEFSRDESLTDDSDDAVPTEQAVRSYVNSNAGGSPNGSDGDVQFNNAGSFGGASQLNWDDTNNRLGIGTSSPSNALDVSGSALLNSGTAVNEFSIDENLTDNSDNAVPTEQAIKQYVDNQSTTPAGSDGAVQYKSGSNLTGNASRLSVSSSGNVGVNTSSPSTELEVDGVASASAVKPQDTTICIGDLC